MADDNQQWPSEDEDFDAVSDNDKSTTAVADAPAPKTVTISTPDDEADEAEAAPEAPAAEEAPEAPEPKAEAPIRPTPAVKPAAAATPPAASVTSTPPRANQSGNNAGRTIFELVLVLVIIALGLWSWTLYSDRSDLRKQVNSLNTNPQVAIQKQTQDLLNKVGKLIQLPTGETPTIANVTDAAAAKKQSAFFDSAQNGDKVLMYVKAGEAILYRPSTNKIVLVAPLTFTNSAATATPTPSPTAKK